MLLSEGQISDYKSVTLMIEALPRANALLADRGYDADRSRTATETGSFTECGH
jgi:IS5 family transposase